MARTLSTMMLELGQSAPDFSLPDAVGGASVSLASHGGSSGSLVMFICNHCPYVMHINPELVRLGEDYAGPELGMVAIVSNDADNYPDDAPDKLKSRATELGYRFAYCHDESQEIAKAYTAACTPDFFLFDADRRLVYRGQLDESRPENGLPVTGKDLRAAIDAVLAGRAPASEQKPSMGCNIKWKPDNAPDYSR